MIATPKENMNQNILHSLIRIPSITGDLKQCNKIITFADSLLKNQEVETKLISVKGKPILIWGETDLSKTKWLINSHLDVVPGSSEQFIPQVKKGKVWGRGSADTKAGCAIMLAKAKTWREITADKHLTFMLVVDEEIGGPSTKEVLPRMSSLKGAIFLEPTNQQMIVQAKGIMQIQITATGKSCHGSRPWEGSNAIEQLIEGLVKLRQDNPSHRRETHATTFNFSQIEGGNAINQVPAHAKLMCDIRWNPLDDPKKIISLLRESFDSCQITPKLTESPINCPIGSKLHSSFSDSLRSQSINPINGFEHGSSDARHCTALGIPAIVFGPKGKNFHADNEWVCIESMKNVSNVLNHWITNI